MALPAAMPSSFSNLHHHTGHYLQQPVLFARLNIHLYYHYRSHLEVFKKIEGYKTMIHAEKNVFRVKSCFFDQFLIYDIYI